MRTASGAEGALAPVATPIGDLANNALIIRLHFTVNHLSRWLTPIHDPSRLTRTPRRGEPTAKELLIELRDEELRVFPLMHAISIRTQPDLDRLPEPRPSAPEVAWDQTALPLEIMAQFRRFRQSTCSLLRTLPDSAWERGGTSRRGHDWTIRALAEHLAVHDERTLRELDLTLDRAGAREGITPASTAHLDELLKLVPSTRRDA
ncbi:MAG: hypothetical protein M3R06_01485 [Chloroflexota bacterium]|nr:hypothetical protein [Chloroflexota bacterium]